MLTTSDLEQILPKRLYRQLPHCRRVQHWLNHSAFLQQKLQAYLNTSLNYDILSQLMCLSWPDEAALWYHLRQVRQFVQVHLALHDLAGQLTLEEVCQTMSDFAEISVRKTLAWYQAQLTQRFGQPIGHTSQQPQQLIVVGMGKLGGSELNVSSDIDLVFLYPEEGQTNGPRTISNHDYFTKLCKKLIAALDTLNDDGFVFRVDCRLRPYGEEGTLAVSFDRLEHYFITEARTWERFAWLKARPFTGQSHTELMKLIKPFVYRKYFDFSAIHAVRTLHRKVQSQLQTQGLKDNIKLGVGGIRNIEFFIQAIQIIRGGRMPELQHRNSLETLARLQTAKLLSQPQCEQLTQAYRFLRQVEHRCMYFEDQQTQNLPQNTQDQAYLAISTGYPNWHKFYQALTTHQQHVSTAFNGLFAESNHSLESTQQSSVWEENQATPAQQAALKSLGYGHPIDSSQIIADLRTNRRYRLLPDEIQNQLTAVIAEAVVQASRHEQPDLVLKRIISLFEAISRRHTYISLLYEYPHVLARISDLCDLSAWGAEYLSKHPILLDELISPQGLDIHLDWQSYQQTLRQRLESFCDHSNQHDVERRMDFIRDSFQSQLFRLLINDLTRGFGVEIISDYLSQLVDIILEESLRQCWQQLQQKHPNFPHKTPCFAIIGYGKLGGKELGYTSDLDLVFIFGTAEYQGNFDLTPIYHRLGIYLNHWINSKTISGGLFEPDYRLRPNGDSGPLVCHQQAFEYYQHHSAWLWEHQALTRSRFITGDPQLQAWFETLRRQIIQTKRAPEPLRENILAMRNKMLQNHTQVPGYFHIKKDPGGIIDIEFIVQYQVLAFAHAFPKLVENIGNIQLLSICAQAQLIDPTLTDQVIRAYRSYRRTQHSLMLKNITQLSVPQLPFQRHIQAVRTLWDQILIHKHASN